MPVPRVVDVDGSRGVVLQEDLGDCTLQEALRDCGEGRTSEMYLEAVGALARLQREAARGPQTAECFRIAFDIEKLSWELHYFQKHFLEGLRGCDLGVEDRATLSEAFHQLSQEIASWPRVLCHRDYHSRNLMLHRGRLYWIDFQDARMGPATYDLASLLRDAYVDVAEELQEELTERFRQQALPEEPREVFRRRFDLMCVQRNLKALGTFGYMATVRHSDVYLPYIPRTLAHARRNLSRYPGLEPLWRTLARHLPELGITETESMNTVRIEDFGKHVGEELAVRGWLHNKRSSGKLQFLIVRDGSGYAQAVVSKKAVTPEAWEALEKAGQESSLEVVGQRPPGPARAGRLRGGRERA